MKYYYVFLVLFCLSCTPDVETENVNKRAEIAEYLALSYDRYNFVKNKLQKMEDVHHIYYHKNKFNYTKGKNGLSIAPILSPDTVFWGTNIVKIDSFYNSDYNIFKYKILTDYSEYHPYTVVFNSDKYYACDGFHFVNINNLFNDVLGKYENEKYYIEAIKLIYWTGGLSVDINIDSTYLKQDTTVIKYATSLSSEKNVAFIIDRKLIYISDKLLGYNSNLFKDSTVIRSLMGE